MSTEDKVLPVLRGTSSNPSGNCLLARMPENFKLSNRSNLQGKEIKINKKLKDNEGEPVPQQLEYILEDVKDVHPKTKKSATFRGELVKDNSCYAILVKKQDSVEMHLVNAMVTFKKMMNLESKPIDNLLKAKRGRNSLAVQIYGLPLDKAGQKINPEEPEDEEYDPDLEKKKKKKDDDDDDSESSEEDDLGDDKTKENDLNPEFERLAQNKGLTMTNQSEGKDTTSKKKETRKEVVHSDEEDQDLSDIDFSDFSDNN